VAYAVSQFSTTRSMVAVLPRSTRIHCGSLNWLDQRVPGLPSTAAEAGRPACSTDEAVAGRPWESRVLAAVAWCTGTRAPIVAARAAATAARTRLVMAFS
jgi:hypothetical protein